MSLFRIIELDDGYEELPWKLSKLGRFRNKFGFLAMSSTVSFNNFSVSFQIPISTLGAVNQFLNNGAAAHSGVAVTKTKTVNVEHS